ncbi:MAG TPA: alpha-2-macroglobulin family protein [Chitinophagaceae bacterium]|nr:alpha-2-macroglobulin family protein [Chitinophagaceae bacterium]
MHFLRPGIVSAFLIFSLSLFAQQPIRNYEKEWTRVEGFIKKNLPKSALQEVRRIYTLAKSEKQDAQVVKSLVYMTRLQSELREDNELLSISEIEKEITTSREPATSILSSLLAGLYWNYYQQHRWELYQRSETRDFKKDDISTWSAEDFHRRIGELFLRSLQNEKLLQQTRLEPFDAIITKGNVRHLRPTLFDLLAHRALDYFQNDERDIRKPAYAFEINQAEAFDPAESFVKRHFTTRDTFSLQHKALLLYQRILGFHLADQTPDALIDADIQRISFVFERSVHPEKDRLYVKALEHITAKFSGAPAADQAWYLMARHFENKAATYRPYGDSTHRLDRVRAREICQRVLQQKDSSEGRVNCQNLLAEIGQKQLHFKLEKVNLPNQPFRALMQYRNLSRVYLRIARADEKLKDEADDRYSEKYWNSILALPPVRNWEQSLTGAEDLQTHAAEIKVEALPAGEYMLVVSSEPDFKNKTALLGARLFFVSSISYIRSNHHFFVLHRDHGQPLAGATVQLWEQRYDYQKSRYVREKGKQYRTDNKGHFRHQKSSDPKFTHMPYRLEIAHGGERLLLDDPIHDYYFERERPETEPATSHTFLFTDRSLYRPGQTVFFKGIVIRRNPGGRSAAAASDYDAVILLLDANSEPIDSMRIRSNQYGSFSGEFTLPQNRLNGQFSIHTRPATGMASFRVEEYKRPKFFVEFEQVKESYRVNDRIRVTGLAKAYAGNVTDNALVRYRVVRQPRFPYPWIFWRWWEPPAEEMEIAHGETRTDRNGRFTVEFTAIPDLSLDRKLEPVFDYTIYADVTDQAGETRSGEKTISAGYKSLLLQLGVPETISSDSLRRVQVTATNMSGEFQPARVKLTITRLQPEARLIRERYWQRPDQFTMTREEYLKNFPHDEYDNERDPRSWKRGELVLERRDTASRDGNFPIPQTIPPGMYEISVTTTDKDGQEIKDVRFVDVFDEKARSMSTPKYLWARPASPVEPGERALVNLGTSATDAFLIQTVDKDAVPDSARPAISILRLNNEKTTIGFDASESDRGGFGVSWAFVRHNRLHQFGQVIQVPWSNKDLRIEFATFRDKTLPGSEEKWKVRVTGNKGELVAAEMLAGMYDASLDQFYPHGWSVPGIWPAYWFVRNWTGDENFREVSSQEKYVQQKRYRHLDKRYDRLFNEEIGSVVSVGYGRRRAMNEMAEGIPAPTMAQEKLTLDTAADGDQVSNQQDKLRPPAPPKPADPGVQVRKNFNETAFFFPELRTDASGAIEFAFTMPEALTRWKLMLLAHTKEAAFGSATRELVTQKELMVQPNAPRFLREGDRMEFSTRIVNLSGRELTGQAELQLIDARTGQRIDGWLRNIHASQFFTVAAGESGAVKFPIEVPYQFNTALTWRVIARAENFIDGVENIMPVLTNRILVTETLPLSLRGTTSKTYRFDKLLASGGSPTLQHHALTVEYTSNPAWLAVQALPYLMEFPYECAEQTWNRYYANSLASFIAGSSPRIKQIFERWKTLDTAALLSNLQKNQDLKSVLLEETPWVLEAKTESEQKRNIALLFDLVRMSSELNNAYEKLRQMQSPNGGFVWFAGGPDDRYMTQYILTGIGHLRKLGAVAPSQESKLRAIMNAALPYLDQKIKSDYDELVRNKANLRNQQISMVQIQYLYMRSFFPEHAVASAARTAYNYYYGQAAQFWTRQSKYMQGMIALARSRAGDPKIPQDIIRSLRETSITNEELGMYWRDFRTGWFWHEAPVETQALLIEAFHEIARDQETVDDLKTWLLKHKQTNHWRTTKATAEACFALLLQGSDWIAITPTVEIRLGATTIQPSATEAGTGYFRQSVDPKRINAEMGNINVAVTSTAKTTSASWGAVYWQYFEDMDKVTAAATPLQLTRKLFVEKNSDRGPVLAPVNDGDVLHVGDKLRIRIELRVDREMEYVHMKDQRASGVEPVNVLSGYKWQGGLGYYESTRDASTNFFFDRMRRGTYVFEYPAFVTHAGNFSNGITSIQSMYAPEFSAHSEGVRIVVERD